MEPYRAPDETVSAYCDTSTHVMQALAWHRTKQEADKLTAGDRYQDMDLVFAGQLGQPLDLRNTTARHFRPLLAKANLPIMRVYDLRHTHATLMLSAGVPLKVVSERLGHASAMMTLNVYAHVLSGQQENAVGQLESYMAAEPDPGLGYSCL